MCFIPNSYLSIADNDRQFIKWIWQGAEEIGNYNLVASHCSQILEKSLKAIVEVKLVGKPNLFSLLHTHNLRSIASTLNQNIPNLHLDIYKCKFVGDYYYDAAYPGEDFTIVSREEAIDCIEYCEEINDLAHEILDNINDTSNDISPLDSF